MDMSFREREVEGIMLLHVEKKPLGRKCVSFFRQASRTKIMQFYVKIAHKYILVTLVK